MKKDIASRLNEVAASMPIIFEWKTESILMKGWELNLTPLGDIYRLEKEKDYTVEVPVMVAVEHKQQLKDAYKRGGMPEVIRYHRSVMDKIKNNDSIKHTTLLQ